MMEIAICDDDASQLDSLCAMLDIWAKERTVPVHVRRFQTAQELFDACSGDRPSCDIFLLDIVMPGIDGIGLGTMLRRSGEQGLIIYLTASSDYAVDSYSVRAFQYLLKPIDRNRLFSVLDEAADTRRSASSTGIQIKTRSGVSHVPLSDIYYAELSRRSIHYTTKAGSFQSTSIREPFSQAVAPLLRDRRFALVGASFAVNLSEIRSVEKGAALLTNGARVTLPASACAGLRGAWSDYWLDDNT